VGPCVDAACLARNGWHAVRAAVARRTYKRAVTWYRTFGIEQVASAVAHGEAPETVADYVERAVRWLETARPSHHGRRRDHAGEPA